jgi:sterol desaturase/sphingolipid hydroxylase (fatty acid hydroxylase superfamily)
METLIGYFSAMPDWKMLAWLFVCLFGSIVLESLIPLVRFDYQKLKHDAFNIFLLLFNNILLLPMTLALAAVIVWSETQQVGLLYHLDLPLWLELLMAVMALDFVAQYGVHYCLHHVNWMWRLHMIHHADTHVDATTGTRHHIGDLAFRFFASGIAIVLFGIPAVYYLIYRMITIFFGYFTHANIRLPGSLDRCLSYLLVTPDMHKFHHHDKVPWTDTNFGNVFSIWDRIFGTLTYANTRDICYGLDTMDGNRDLDFMYQLKAPVDSSIGKARA